MRKVKTVGSISEFLNPKEERSVIDKVVAHYENNQLIYNVAGMTVIFTLTGADFGFAEGSAIDKGAKKIYDKIIDVGKWFIIVRGSIDILRNVSNGDFESAKKGGLSYILIYVILLALPWSLNEIENVFKEM